MKDEKAKYLIIDAEKINKQLYNCLRIFSLNDFENIYEPSGMIDAKKIFKENGLPEEFHKIIVKINVPFFLKKDAEEYTMGFPFDIAAGKIEKENNNKYITICNRPIYYDGQVFRDKIKFKTELEYSNYIDVMKFLAEVAAEGYLKAYLKSIKEFFDISINLDLIFKSWNESKYNPKKALKIYKRNIL